jgi:flagellar biosynthesis/type III secretory pathway M-ring protein FliF/YscJ
MAIVLAAIVGFAARDTRALLFATPLRGDQLTEVEQRLAAWEEPYAATADNVRVAQTRRNGVLLRLALAGVPHAHLTGSDEALAHIGALTPQSVLEAQTRDALAADLALGLRGLDGVADARVVIAPASAGTYADDERHDASASVRISLSPGAHLNARTVGGIAAFVAGGVPGLDAAHVIVLDDRGLALASDADDAADVQSALQSALDDAFGRGATIVRVHREPFGERRDVHDTRHAALAGAVARSTTDERFASAAKRYSKGSATEDLGSETHEEHRVTGADATARLSVAVLVDSARRLDLAAIRALAAATAGVREERGDSVRVEAVVFAPALRTAPNASMPGWLLALLTMLPQILTGAALVCAVAFGARPAAALATRIVETASARAATQAVSGLPPAGVRGALAGEPPHVAAAIISALPTSTAAAVLELYPPDERSAIVRRLARGASPHLVPHAEELLRG